jgi:hypothetical protein
MEMMFGITIPLAKAPLVPETNVRYQRSLTDDECNGDVTRTEQSNRQAARSRTVNPAMFLGLTFEGSRDTRRD